MPFVANCEKRGRAANTKNNGGSPGHRSLAVSNATLAPELARALSAAQRLRAAAPPPPSPLEPSPDEQPWPGIATFTEELVQASRELRRLREAQATAAMERADHEAREDGLRYALIQAWRVAAISALVAVGAVASAIYAWWR